MAIWPRCCNCANAVSGGFGRSETDGGSEPHAAAPITTTVNRTAARCDVVIIVDLTKCYGFRPNVSRISCATPTRNGVTRASYASCQLQSLVRTLRACHVRPRSTGTPEIAKLA